MDILQGHHLNPVVIEYLRTPLSLEQLTELRSHFDLGDFVRTTEPVFKDLELTLNEEEKVLAAMINNPILMQRPIITSNGKAIIARSTEKILALL